MIFCPSSSKVFSFNLFISFCCSFNVCSNFIIFNSGVILDSFNLILNSLYFPKFKGIESVIDFSSSLIFEYSLCDSLSNIKLVNAVNISNIFSYII